VPKETKEEKAARYLVEGHVDVQFHSPASTGPFKTKVHVYSDSGSDPYVVTFDHGEWHCDCPAQIVCAHILACMVIFPNKVKDATRGVLFEGEDEFAALLDG